MKLMAHNFLSSKFLKDVTAGYPLKLNCITKEEKEFDFDDGMLCAALKKIDYPALRGAAFSIGEGSDKLPIVLPECDWQKFPQELKEELHRLIFCVDIIDGDLECPETGRKFPIKDGIPNMLCTENEL